MGVHIANSRHFEIHIAAFDPNPPIGERSDPLEFVSGDLDGKFLCRLLARFRGS
jgi:hypothetical protein